MPPQRAVIEAGNVKVTGTFASDSTFVAPPKGDPALLFFGFPSPTAVNLAGDVQVGLHAASERSLCDLEFLQVVIPSKQEVVWCGIKEGSIVSKPRDGVLSQLFIDGHGDPNFAVPSNSPFMSTTKHLGQGTRDGHFKNVMTDSLSLTATHTTSHNGEQRFLWRITREAAFTTFLVFIHPNGDRQPIAMVKWVFSQNHRLQWRQGRPQRRSGVTSISASRVETSPAILEEHVATVTNPPRDWIVKVVNPTVLDPLGAAFGASANISTFSLTRHPEVEADFFVP